MEDYFLVFFTRDSCAEINCIYTSLFFGSMVEFFISDEGIFSSFFKVDGVGFSCAGAGEFNKDCKNWNKPKGSMQKSLQNIKKS